MPRYAAKLLFQFRVRTKAGDGKRRLCEERIVNFDARSPSEALRKAKRLGKTSELDYDNSDGNRVFFEFVGVSDMIKFTSVTSPAEVWYDIVQRHTPMERRTRLIPADKSLLSRVSGK